MLSRRECVAWLMFLFLCVVWFTFLSLIDILFLASACPLYLAPPLLRQWDHIERWSLGCVITCTSCRLSRLESVARFTFFSSSSFLPLWVCVCVHWIVGGFLHRSLITIGGLGHPSSAFLYAFCEAWAGSFFEIFAGTLSSVGGIELFAPHCCLWRNPFTGISLKTEVLVRYYGSSLQYAMGMNWFTSIEISMLKFGMWSSAQFATVDWQLSFNPFCGIGCDLLSTALRMGPSTGFCIIMGDGIMWSGCQEFWNKYLWVHWSVLSPLPLAHRPFHPINWERSFGCYGFRVHTCWSGGRI